MKLRNKLILSCAALAAVATTAVSTTFAWYTANDTVKANGITGKTSSQDATLLLISKTGISGQWGASVDINSSAVTLDPVTYMTADKYVKAKDVTSDNFATKKASLFTASTGATPAYTAVGESAEFNATTNYFYKKEAGKYYQWDSANNQEGAEATGGLAGTNQYISFYLYFKSGSAQALDVTIDKFNLRNTTYAEGTTTLALPTQTVLAEGTGASGSTYTVDMLKATNIVITQLQGVESASTSSTSPVIAAGTGTRNAYACDSMGAAGTIGSDANAHTYYNNVKTLSGADALSTSIESSETSIGTVDTLNGTAGTPATKYTFTVNTGAGATGSQDSILMVRFDIYLDGWDKLCFDACRKQTFALDMEFTGKPHTGA